VAWPLGSQHAAPRRGFDVLWNNLRHVVSRISCALCGAVLWPSADDHRVVRALVTEHARRALPTRVEGTRDALLRRDPHGADSEPLLERLGPDGLGSPHEYQLLLQHASLALGALVVSAFASYWIALTYVPIFVVLLYIGQYFKKSLREIKRLEGITRTPVYNLFSETLSGLDTICAFRMEDDFTKLNRRVVDANANLFLTYWAANRWLPHRWISSRWPSFSLSRFIS